MQKITVGDIYKAIDAFAPFATALPFDNAGLLVGSPDAEVTGVAFALDMTCELIDWAHEHGCNLVVSHHPVIFKPVGRVGSDHPVYRLARYEMSAICAHTNLDCAPGGVNDVLAEALGLHEIRPLADPEYPGYPPMARVGALPREMSAQALAGHVRDALGVAAVGYADGGEPIRTVALCGGAGADLLLPAAEAGAQALVTADVRHHELLDAMALGVTLIDAGHFATETVVMAPLCKRLSEQFPQAPMHLFAQPNPLRFSVQ